MDRIQTLLKEIQNDRSLMDVHYTRASLNNTAEIFERYGFGTTKVFLLEKRSKEADALLKILGKFENIPEIVINRSIGRTIIKTLDTLKSKRTEV